MLKQRQNLELLEKAILSDRKRALIWAILLLPIGIFLCQLTHLDSIAGIVLPMTGLILLLICFKLLYDVILNWDLVTHPLILIIKCENERIVWVYSVATQISPFGIDLFSSGEFFFKLEDGKEHTLNIPIAQLQPLSASLNALLPNTTFGYTEERDQWYEIDPLLLRK